MTYEQMLALPVSQRLAGMVVHTNRGSYQLQKMVDNTAWVALQHNLTTGKWLPASALGYVARIIDGKLVRVARVTWDAIDYNYEN